MIQIAENFVKLANNTKIAFYGSFSTSPEFAIREMSLLDVRIIVGMVGESEARKLLCQVKISCRRQELVFRGEGKGRGDVYTIVYV